jgi:hypothetical protein
MRQVGFDKIIGVSHDGTTCYKDCDYEKTQKKMYAQDEKIEDINGWTKHTKKN